MTRVLKFLISPVTSRTGGSIMGSYTKYRDEELKKNPHLKAEYDALEPEYDIIQAMIDVRKSQNMTKRIV